MLFVFLEEYLPVVLGIISLKYYLGDILANILQKKKKKNSVPTSILQ